MTVNLSVSSPFKSLAAPTLPPQKLKPGWSKEEKESLKELAQRKLSLKAMPALMRRSPTAVNKALTRFGIRALSSPLPSRKPSSMITSDKPLEVPQAEPLAIWCTLEEAIEWLEQEQGKIIPVPMKGFKGFLLYSFQSKPYHLMTAAQVLIFANELRTQKELPLFHIPSLTGE